VNAADGINSLPMAARLRLDHGALAALLVMTPTSSIVSAIQKILSLHNTLEEGGQGVYAQCERLSNFDSAAILNRIENAPPVAMAPYSDIDIAKDSARAALARGGYSFDL
jgi:hypothetical protein